MCLLRARGAASSVLPRSRAHSSTAAAPSRAGALRGSWRMYREQFWPMFNQGNARWALLVGTDHSHGVLAHQIQSYGELPYRIRGFLCTEETEKSRLGQIPVLGKLEDVREVAAGAKATDILVIAGTLPGLAVAEPDERLRKGRPEPEDHPPPGRPPRRRPSHSHPRHRDRRPAAARPGPIGHQDDRQAPGGPHGHGDRGGGQHRLGNLPPGAALQSARVGAGRPRRKPHLQDRPPLAGHARPRRCCTPASPASPTSAADAASLPGVPAGGGLPCRRRTSTCR